MPMICASLGQIGRRSPKSVRSSPIVLENEAATGIKQTARRRARAKQSPAVIFTVGHSTRPIEEFEALLLAHGVKQLVDVRTVPRSRHNPQFNGDRRPASLKKAGIGYRPVPGLGGLRRARRDSINSGWHNASFRGFADYVQTPGFENALVELIRIARTRRTAIECAEAVPWRIVLMDLEPGAHLVRHQTRGTVVIQVVSGHIKVRVFNEVLDVPVGHAISLDPHLSRDVEALDETALLITIAWPEDPEPCIVERVCTQASAQTLHWLCASSDRVAGNFAAERHSA